MEICSFQGESRRHRGVDLSAGNNVNAHSLLGGDLIKPLEGGRLGGILHVAAAAKGLLHRRKVGAHAIADARLVVKVKRRSVGFGQRRKILPCKGQSAFGIPRHVFANQILFVLYL